RSIYKGGKPKRNCTITTIAPTGSISLIAGCSSGIEPVFALAYRHTFLDSPVATPVFERIAREEGFYSEELVAKVMETGSCQGLPEVPENWQRIFRTAHEIDPEWHVKMQAAFQKHTDNAVSKTINLPHDATVEDVRRAYLLAWELNCKGITVFRDGCKGEQVLESGSKKEPPTPTVKARPPVLSGRTYRKKTPLGNVYITINRDEQGEPLELFATSGKAGSDVGALTEAVGRLVSFALRLPSPITPTKRAEMLIDQLIRIGGRGSVGFGPDQILSIPDATARALMEELGFDGPRIVRADICPECGVAALVHEEGCANCKDCGYKKC
ncbi:hypothetical protein HY373_02535, partial [Candidatus Berkelbacteria bacterium]|nr:hypothetical protein [Candidatus Berkelbacteria bacterium]